MLGEREALVLEVRAWDVHGVAHVDVTLAFPDGRVDTARLGSESAPADLRAGERVLVRSVLQTAVEIVRVPA
jgi:hypothetical protein